MDRMVFEETSAVQQAMRAVEPHLKEYKVNSENQDRQSPTQVCQWFQQAALEQGNG